MHIKQYISRNLDIAGAKKRFTGLQNNELPTHAQMQMVIHLLKSSIGFDEIFSYFGCSRLSCFMCHAFLKSCGKLEVRGCHGMLYPKWTIAITSDLTPKLVNLIVSVLGRMRNVLARKLLEPIETPNRHRTESSADVTSTQSTHGNNDIFIESSINGSRFDVQATRAREHAWLVNVFPM